MENQTYILAIDSGTQSVRALLFDLRGNLVERVRVPIEPYTSPQPGWAEQDPEYFWEALCEACQRLWKQTAIPKEAIAGLALTTQRSTLVNVNKAGQPLRPAIVWLDQRRTEGVKPVGGLWGLAFKASGMTETVAYLQAEAEANWIRTHQPEIWEQTHKYLLLSGYLTYRLTGQFVDSVGCQVAYMPFDYKALAWAKAWDWKWQAVPMEPAIRPTSSSNPTRLGSDRRGRAATGLPEGLQIIAAAADKRTVIGAGGLGRIGCLGFGTTATSTPHTKYIEVIPLIPPYPAAAPGRYSLEIQVYRGYWMVNWFKQEFGLREQRLADERGIMPEDLFDELVKQVPPGSMGLMLQPYWSPGLKVPGPEAKGAIIGFGDVHTRAHIYRAMLEGLAYALREGGTISAAAILITELRVSGGGSQSDAAMQLTADIFDLPAARPHVYETSGLGAAIDAAVGLGLHPDFDTAVREMTRVGDVFTPNPQTRDIYDGLYHRVYKQMYERLKPLYEEIREITGYPEKVR